MAQDIGATLMEVQDFRAERGRGDGCDRWRYLAHWISRYDERGRISVPDVTGPKLPH